MSYDQLPHFTQLHLSVPKTLGHLVPKRSMPACSTQKPPEARSPGASVSRTLGVSAREGILMQAVVSLYVLAELLQKDDDVAHLVMGVESAGVG